MSMFEQPYHEDKMNTKRHKEVQRGEINDADC